MRYMVSTLSQNLDHIAKRIFLLSFLVIVFYFFLSSSLPRIFVFHIMCVYLRRKSVLVLCPQPQRPGRAITTTAPDRNYDL